jgi:hypothetical protein
MKRLPWLIIALSACGMQRTGGEQSIPKVLHTDASEISYCQHDGDSRVTPITCKPQTTYRCPVDGASKCFRAGERFNPLQYCNTDCREKTDD